MCPKKTVFFCIAIKFLYVENMEGKREQMKFAHVKVIYTLCVSKIIFFFYNLQSTNYVMTPCVTPLSQRLEEFLHCRRLSSKLKSNRPLQQILRILKAADSVDSQETRWTEKNRENDGMTNRKRKHQTNNRWDLYIANK